MHFFYSNDLSGEKIILPDEEVHHANVLRLNIGDKVSVLDGKGTVVQGNISILSKREIIILKESSKFIDRSTPILSIALAPTKNIDRYEWFLEKATELGVQYLIPIITHQSERRQINVEKLNKKILGACKQSGRAWIPELHLPISFASFVTQDFAGDKFIAHIAGKLLDELVPDLKHLMNALVCIGPEGDFTAEELNLAIKNGFKSISLGDYRLRTETAGLVMAAKLGL
ncbi:MAG: RsmE family RNA methyltransferase [Saprospiraceae bacterium]